jgi:D-sedoheptulose 7-phosphate isomerase
MASLPAVDELIADLTAFRARAGSVDETGEVLVGALRAGKKILACGNGGSAAAATHLAEELVGRYKGDRRSLAAVSLAADPALMTCIANDFGFEFVFSRQVEGLGAPGDVVVLFSTSGNSVNLVRAVEAARAAGCVSVALRGTGGGRLGGLADYEVVVGSESTARIQEVHTLILHCWLERIEGAFRS